MVNTKYDSVKNSNKILIIILIVMIISLIGQIYYIINLKKSLDLTKTDLDSFKALYKKDSKNLRDSDDELKNSISKLSESLLSTESNLKKDLATIRASTSSDFSEIIERSVDSVVSIRTDISQGTGFIITRNGYIVTNAHVLENAHYAEAITSNKEVLDMKLVGYNQTLDLALLKVDGNHMYLDLGNSDDVKVGEKVIAIGNPLGLSFSVTEGIISAKNRNGNNGLPFYLQTDASLNPGNSGGPLIDTDGDVIGINNFKARAENIGFALESDFIKSTVNEITKEKLNMTLID